MTIKSTFLWTSVHTAIKIVSGIIMNKIIAIYLGPAGLALIGQFQNFSQIVINIASGSFHTGITKYTAEYHASEVKRQKLWSNAFLISFLLSLVSFITILLFNDFFTKKIFFNAHYHIVLIIFAFSIPFYVLNLLYISIVNGFQNIKLYTKINILMSLATLMVTVSLTWLYKMEGALYSLIISQLLIFIITFYYIQKEYPFHFFRFKELLHDKDVKIIKKLLAYGSVSFASGVFMSLMLLAVRYIIVDNFSLDYAGYWEALWKISTYFLMISMLPMSIYYIPKFSSMHDHSSIKILLLEAYKIFIPLQLLAGILIYIFRDQFILLLFSKDFLFISSVLIFMLLGDIFRISGYIIGNLFYAKALMKRFLLLDLLYNSLLTGLVYIFIQHYGFSGVGYAYLVANLFVLNYFVYFYSTISHEKEFNIL